MSLITDWFSSLKSNHQASNLMQPLQQLQAELQSGSPSNEKLRNLLTQLADQTETLSNTAEGDLTSRLSTLAQALRNFASQLSTAV